MSSLLFAWHFPAKLGKEVRYHNKLPHNNKKLPVNFKVLERNGISQANKPYLVIWKSATIISKKSLFLTYLKEEIIVLQVQKENNIPDLQIVTILMLKTN